MAHDTELLTYDTTLLVEKSLYPAQVVLKTSYAFIDTCYVHIDETEDKWVVHLTPKDNQANRNHLKGNFENELISQAVRLNIYQRTHGLREMLLARSLSTSLVVEGGASQQVETETIDISDAELDSILKDWFDDGD